MILTIILALLFAGARGLRERASSDFLWTVVFSLNNVALGVAAAWAALGLGQPIRRCPVVLLLSAALGALFWYSVLPPIAHVYWNITIYLIMQAAITFGSLLAVRSCGFRLVRQTSAERESGSMLPGPS